MYVVSSVLAVLFINYLLLYIQKTVSQPGSDHPFHIGLILGIKENNHRYINKYPNIIGEKNFAYPQFIHWILSFLPTSIVKQHYNYVGLTLNYLLLISFVAIGIWAYEILQPELPLSLFILYAGLLYVVTPFSWAGWNAKNTGISARGLALLLGYIYQFLIMLYHYSNDWVHLSMIFIVVYIIILSSQFATQYVLISMPFYAILYSNYFLLVFPFLAALAFYLLHKDVAVKYFRGQYWHKTIYFNYLAKLFLLEKRPSIWRDLIYDIWIKIKQKPTRGFLYAYYNPVLTIIVAIPCLGFLALIAMRTNVSNIHTLEKLMIWNIVIALILFVLTSFKKTRFLGEPERYVEFAIPFITLLVVSMGKGNAFATSTILAISILLLMFQFSYPIIVKKRRPQNEESNMGDKIHNLLVAIKEENEELRVFSNNKEYSKYGLASGANILLTNLTSFHTGKHSFTEIFPNKYPEMSIKVIAHLLLEFGINCFILDTSNCLYKDIPKIAELNFIEYHVEPEFTIYMRN